MATREREAREAARRAAGLFGHRGALSIRALGDGRHVVSFRVPAPAAPVRGRVVRKNTNGATDLLQVQHEDHHFAAVRVHVSADSRAITVLEFGAGEQAELAVERWMNTGEPSFA